MWRMAQKKRSGTCLLEAAPMHSRCMAAVNMHPQAASPEGVLRVDGQTAPAWKFMTWQPSVPRVLRDIWLDQVQAAQGAWRARVSLQPAGLLPRTSRATRFTSASWSFSSASVPIRGTMISGRTSTPSCLHAAAASKMARTCRHNHSHAGGSCVVGLSQLHRRHDDHHACSHACAPVTVACLHWCFASASVDAL